VATLFTLCAVLGGTLLVCQFLLTLIGLGGDQDFDHPDVSVDHDVPADAAADGGDVLVDHHASGAFFKLLTFRTLVTGVTFFGLAGRAAQESEFDPTTVLLAAVATGVVAMWCVHWLMRQISRLRADGTLKIEDAVGQTGVVSLSVPGASQGLGKVNVMLQNRTLELTAQSANGALPTGTPVRITRQLGSELVEVAAAESQPR